MWRKVAFLMCIAKVDPMLHTKYILSILNPIQRSSTHLSYHLKEDWTGDSASKPTHLNITFIVL